MKPNESCIPNDRETGTNSACLNLQASRAQILDKATEYIQFMRRKNHTHQQDIDDLKKQNAVLEQQGMTGSSWYLTKDFLSFCNCAYVRLLSQFVHSRRPKGTARQTTLLTAAFTRTAKAARCRPSMEAPTPALNQSRMSLPTGRSCAESPARCCQALVLQTDSVFLGPPASCLCSELRAGQVTS